MRQKHFYEFGPFRLDVALNRLERAGELISLPPRAFDLLVLFATNTDRVMPKTELMERLWPNTFVEEANLTQHVYTLRKALGDQPNGQPYIETIPRRGYRLAADVHEVTVDPSDGVAPLPLTPPLGAVVLEGERKHATVLQCRIANAAAVVERLGSAALHDLTRDLLAVASEEIGRYEGAISQRHTDGFEAVFGAPAVHEDDARRATLAALTIQQRFRRLAPADGPDDEHVDLQIGVSTGSLVVTRVVSDGRIEYSTVGDTARTADLLQQLAEPGTMLIGEATRGAVDGYVEVAPTGIQAGGTPAFRVVGSFSPSAARPTRFPRPLAPFVGRRHELALLHDLVAQARAGKGQVVSVVGEPGMGKSRLVHELMQAVSASAPMTLLKGRCVSYGGPIPYLPLADLVRTYYAVSDTDAPETIRHAVERAGRGTGVSAEASACLLRLTGVVDGASGLDALSPEALKVRTFEALRSLLLDASTRRPIVIVVEDLHWIDRTSEEFLAALVERLMAARVIVVTTCRPGYRAPWLDRSYLTQVTLTPLAADDAAQLVESAARTRPLPPVISSLILEKAEGNPLFLEELARTVVERGPDDHSIPDTVRGVIMARIDRLPGVGKQLLQTASVLGREVSLPLLARLWRGGDLEATLANLCHAEFLYERLGGDEKAFVFKHALTQDVAYDSLLSRRRRELHLDAAQALEAIHSDGLHEITARLAYHYARTDLIDESVTWLVRAAERAARVYANAEAIVHLDLAARRLQRLPEGPDRDRRMLDVALRHAHSLYFLGRFRESVDVLLPHEARLARLDDSAVTGAYSFWLAHMYSRLGDQPRAAAAARRAIDAATASGDDATLGKAHGVLALEGHWTGRSEEGIAHGKKAITILQSRTDQRWWLGMAHFYLAMNYLLLGDFDEALAETSRSDRIGKEMGDPRLRTYAGFTTAWAESSRGNTDIAIARGRESLDLAPDRVSRAYATLFLAFALLEHGAHEDACDRLEGLVSELEGFAFPQWQALATTWASEAMRRQGRLEEAMGLATRGLALATSVGYGYAIGFAQRTNGRIARDKGLPEEAAAMFADAASTFSRIGAAFEAARQP